jgi:hypothetical protein
MLLVVLSLLVEQKDLVVADLVVLVEIFVSFCRFVDSEKDSFDVVLASDKRFNSRGWSQH